MKKALVIFSGGQDSTTCLFWAKKNFDEVEAVLFDYGQRHLVEIDCARRIAEQTQTPLRLLEMRAFAELGGNALVDPSRELRADGGPLNLPTSFVPGRNIFFFTLAAAYAAQRGITDLIGGMCEADSSGYPDCREAFIESMQQSLSLGMGQEFRLHAPLMHLDKAETFQLAADLGCLETVLFETNTCYRGDREKKWAWGFGCGECPACRLRERGYEEFSSRSDRSEKGIAHGAS